MYCQSIGINKKDLESLRDSKHVANRGDKILSFHGCNMKDEKRKSEKWSFPTRSTDAHDNYHGGCRPVLSGDFEIWDDEDNKWLSLGEVESKGYVYYKKRYYYVYPADDFSYDDWSEVLSELELFGNDKDVLRVRPA